MKGFIDSLNIRYEAVLKSSSDSVFYQNIHSYIDYIIKTPKLAEIVDRAGHDYRDKHSKIWETKTKYDNQGDIMEERTLKLERFNLYTSGYVTLLMRIYYPLEIYKTTNEDDKDQDPCAILMLKGINSSRVKKYMKESKYEVEKWYPKNIKMYNRWYDGQRKFYEDELRKFHIDFLSEVEKLEENNIAEPAKTNSKIPLHINLRTGDFSFYKTTGTISLATQEFKILSALIKSEDYQSSYLSLYKALFPSTEEVRKTQRDTLAQIIRNLKETLGILPKKKLSNKDIFKNIPNIGYRLIFNSSKQNTE